MAPTTPTKTVARKASSSSPKKKSPTKSSPTKTAAIARQDDESKWRKSRLNPEQKIGKTDAKDCYRITDNELPVCVGTQTVTIPKTGEVLKHLYREIEVERAAWRKHGGPEAFEAILDSKRANFLAKPTKKGFKVPNQYGARYKMLFIGRAPNNPPPRPPGFPDWVWRACHQHVEWRARMSYSFGSSEPTELRGDLLRSATAFVQQERYPVRLPLLPESPSVSNLRAVLLRAPSLIGLSYKQTELQFSSFTGNDRGEEWTEYCWKKEYLTELFDALVGVLNEHGEEGWKAVRWEVYDKFQESGLGGIEFNKERGEITWSDDACAWLKGHISSPTKGCYDSYLARRRQHETLESGRRYNDLLPRHDLNFYC
ncbi:hypothetical protein SISSUDRAFT_1043962 [Sistotremastrum suecicum HHB10207 ss-3]|uniref:Uncharacterized protein n=1 Tax=Sistotremastrum suecicum HHB10207 ss-3 TaxID=1314776 RepID=A0A166FH07_9AGAM|nr:hypothetical protein SISSUDRAFT_1043962 [Sistotremastrum suecicum HHB10207 ss-3]